MNFQEDAYAFTQILVKSNGFFLLSNEADFNDSNLYIFLKLFALMLSVKKFFENVYKFKLFHVPPVLFRKKYIYFLN